MFTDKPDFMIGNSYGKFIQRDTLHSRCLYGRRVHHRSVRRVDVGCSERGRSHRMASRGGANRINGRPVPDKIPRCARDGMLSTPLPKDAVRGLPVRPCLSVYWDAQALISHQATKPRRIMLSFSFIPLSLRGFVSLCDVRQGASLDLRTCLRSLYQSDFDTKEER